MLITMWLSAEWQKALYAVGGSEVKKWSLQLRRSVPDGVTPSSNGTSLQQQEMNLIQERTLPSSPSPLYSPHSKASAFIKGGLVQPNARQQLIGGHAIVDNSRGLLQWVQSISFVSVSIDHSLQLVVQAESASQGISLSFVMFRAFFLSDMCLLHFIADMRYFYCYCERFMVLQIPTTF